MDRNLELLMPLSVLQAFETGLGQDEIVSVIENLLAGRIPEAELNAKAKDLFTLYEDLYHEGDAA